MSRVEAMLNAKERLPERLRTVFHLLYVKGLSEEQACAELKLGVAALQQEKTMLLRSLKAAAA